MQPRQLVMRFFILFAALGLLFTSSPAARNLAQAAPANPPAAPDQQEASFILDNVSVQIQTPFLPSPTWGLPSPGNALQVADSSSANPFRDLEVIAAPFGFIPGSESAADDPLPPAAPGLAAAYRAKLRQYRTAEGGHPQPGPTISLFGQPVAGDVSLLELTLNTTRQNPMLYVEWVGEAGPRLWIVRIVQQLPAGTQDLTGQAAWLQSLAPLTLSSPNLANPSTLTPAGTLSPAPAAAGGAAAPGWTLPAATPAAPANPATPTTAGMPPAAASPDALFFPPWWNGSACDDTHYYQTGSRHIHSFALGTSYMHMDTCGPKPLSYNPPYDVYVSFGAGGLGGAAWGEYEWECVEYVMRYLRLRFNVNPYPANGYEVVGNYATYKSTYNPGGPDLEVVPNGYQAPGPYPGDILSYGGPPTGHTSLVKSVSVDNFGNGTISVAEQNNSATGLSTLTVQNWHVIGNAGAVTAWLTGNQDFQPAVGRNQDGRLEVFARGTDGGLYHDWQNSPGGSWSGWNSLGNSIKGNPSVVLRQNGTQEVFVRGTDGDIYHIWQLSPNSGWSSWDHWTAPVKFQGSPRAILNGTNGVHVFAWGADSQLWYAWQPCAGCGWSAWTPLGGIIINNPVVALDSGNRVQVFAQGTDRAAYYRQQTALGSSGWTDWTSLGGTLDGALAVGRNADGRLELFSVATETSGAMWHTWQWQPSDNGSWSGWNQLGAGSWARGAVVGQNLNGSLEVYTLQGGSDPNYTNSLDGITQLNWWSGWAGLGGTWRVGLPGVGSNLDGRLQLFGRGDDKQLYTLAQTAANSTSWTCCTNLGGSWP